MGARDGSENFFFIFDCENFPSAIQSKGFFPACRLPPSFFSVFFRWASTMTEKSATNLLLLIRTSPTLSYVNYIFREYFFLSSLPSTGAPRIFSIIRSFFQAHAKWMRKEFAFSVIKVGLMILLTKKLLNNLNDNPPRSTTPHPMIIDFSGSNSFVIEGNL